MSRLLAVNPLVPGDSGWIAGVGLIGFLIGIVIYLGILALTLWVFYLIIRTAVTNGILKADEARGQRRY
jgi:hypothetical protein